MDMMARLPDMADDALANLHANAVRLAGAGNPKQQRAANALLPAIAAEIATRLARKPPKATGGRPRRAKAAAPAVADAG
ncbi:hypothetical protein [Arenibaculum pallidiluteum]|uniref:hypothetical protein n=1 Tax=Arenibaculum pallidiluteum TaxID=2812559 RepID=UPI001A960530|nr:hypothetical protein [Arenibaculum pallidiluteum]